MPPYHENFNTNGEENGAQSAGLQFHSDDSDFAVSGRKQGEHCTFLQRRLCLVTL